MRHTSLTYLLHRIVWDNEETFNVIFDKYVHIYVDILVGVIVAAEQRRRTAASSTSSDSYSMHQ